MWVPTCLFVCVYVLRIVSTDKILQFTNTLFVLLLPIPGKDGSLHEMLLRETSSVERGQLIAVRGVSASCSLFCLSNNYVALVGLQRQKQGVWSFAGDLFIIVHLYVCMQCMYIFVVFSFCC